VSRQINFGDGTIVSASSATHQYKRAGTYTVLAKVTDNSGASTTASVAVTVKPQYVVITNPTSSTFTGSTLHVVGTAYSGYAVTATQIYVDGVLKYKTAANTASAYLSLSIGKHTIAVQGWDSSGATFKSQITVTRTK
jgi:PKD repeat protein